MRILGIDPGIARVGWAVVETHTPEPIAISFGCITTEKNEKPEDRLSRIHTAVALLCNKFRPDCMSVEDLFFATNAKTAIGVGQSRGVILLAAAEAHIPVVSYTPLAVKRAITGDGKADKKQVAAMIVRILKLKTAPKLDDTADALAIAMTHAYSYKMKQLL
ncbi:MAG: crossover junction endodeoxyribonuclease RuvC [Candidatus Gottesmanbacteria bacterium]|nr:crossover junction endodeoxyribonuclease RuvC [Candidatus Gottesmanbacteria bacterium]